MKAAIWTYRFFDSNQSPVVGGVQTYILELANLLREMDVTPVILDSHVPRFRNEYLGIHVEGIPPAEWMLGISGTTAKGLGLDKSDCIHIVSCTNLWPKGIGRRSIAIQHGIGWDRPTRRLSMVSRFSPSLVNLLRSWYRASAVNQFAVLVCVDLAFPTAAACVFPPLPWERIHYIPNFAPDPPAAPRPTGNINRIVFSRRFEPHRGTRVFEAAVKPLLRAGWEGEVHIVGNGPDEVLLREAFAGLDQVRIYSLPFERRMEAYSEDSLVVIPSLSSEGTSLTCIEAMSCGALVIATGVGGLANVIIPYHNGLQVRPSVRDLQDAIALAVKGGPEIQRMKQTGYETFTNSFTRSIWKSRWRCVIEQRAASHAT